jgi:ribonuclease HI
VTDVDELINPMTGDWDVELVKELFWEEDQQIILAIPVFEGRDNILAWHFDKHGKFSVRSAYKICRDDFIKNSNCKAAQGGSRQQVDPIWKKIWSLNCPNKVKHFLWRMAHDSQPLRCKLVHRGMEIDPCCPVCGRDNEDGGHLFFKCKLAKQVWNLLALEDRRQRLAAQFSAMEAVSVILSEKEEMATLMVITLWSLWTNRNAFREEGRGRRAEELARAIRIYANETSQSQCAPKPHNSVSRVKWSKPPEDFLKLNCDGSFIKETRAGSWGFLIRDHDGDVVLTGRGKINNALSAFHSELIACLQGVQVASDLGIGKLILETDALNVQQAVQAKGFDTRPEGGLIEELKSLARSNFNAFVCNFLGRDGNRAAHALAALGYSCIEGEALITSTIPDDVFVIVSDDLSAE